MALNLDQFRHLYPFESRWFDLDGLRYHYLDEGAGEPVLCVHGNPTWSFYYRNVIAELRASHRVIAVDHIGCGPSDKPDDSRYEYVLRRRVDDLERLIGHLGVTHNVTLIVHDWGGMIGLDWALRERGRAARLVILNTAAFLKPANKRLPIRLAIVRDLTSLSAPLVRGLNAFSWGATHIASAKGMPADVRAAYRAPYDSWQNRIATLRFVQDIPLRPGDASYDEAKWVNDHLADLAGVPMLICWGDRDPVFDTDYCDEWQRRFPDADVHHFPDAGHYCLEDAGDRIVPLIRSFLASNPLPAESAPEDSA